MDPVTGQQYMTAAFTATQTLDGLEVECKDGGKEVVDHTVTRYRFRFWFE